MYFMVTRFLKNVIAVTGLVSVVLSPFFVFSTAFAQISGGVNKGDYELLVPIPEFCAPGVKCVYKVGEGFNSYVNAFIRLAIILAAILSVVMIVFGGFQYMTSESLGLKAEGKERMLNAIIGLVLLSASFLILNTINPNILSFKLDIKSVDVKNNNSSSVSPTTVAEVKSDTSAKPLEQTREQAGITNSGTQTLEARSARPEEALAQLRSQRGSAKLECEKDGTKKFVPEDANVKMDGNINVATIKVSCISVVKQ